MKFRFAEVKQGSYTRLPTDAGLRGRVNELHALSQPWAATDLITSIPARQTKKKSSGNKYALLVSKNNSVLRIGPSGRGPPHCRVCGVSSYATGHSVEAV